MEISRWEEHNSHILVFFQGGSSKKRRCAITYSHLYLLFFFPERCAENRICLANVSVVLKIFTTRKHGTNNLLITFSEPGALYYDDIDSHVPLGTRGTWYTLQQLSCDHLYVVLLPVCTQICKVKHTAISMVFATSQKFKYLGDLTGQFIPIALLQLVHSLLL